jgi:hypothetical protein
MELPVRNAYNYLSIVFVSAFAANLQSLARKNRTIAGFKKGVYAERLA